MAEENGTGSNVVWAIANIIIVAMLVERILQRFFGRNQ